MSDRLKFNLSILTLLCVGLMTLIFSIQNHRQINELTRVVKAVVEIYPIADSQISMYPIPDQKSVSINPEYHNRYSNITRYKELPLPVSLYEPQSYHELFNAVSELSGVSKRMLFKFAATESSFDPNAVAKSTGATGLFQFTEDTWEFVTNRYGKPFGITSKTSRKDVRANALMAAFHIANNIELIKERTGKNNITSADAYIAHLLGRTGALRYFSMKLDHKPATTMRAAAKNNPKFFYAPSNKPLTRQQTHKVIELHLEQKLKEFEITI